MSAKETTPLTAAGGKWSSGLCSCFSDCTSCLTVCCLKPVALGQLSQKVLGYPCLFVTILLFSLCMLEDIFGVFEQAPVSTISQYVPVDNEKAIYYSARAVAIQPFALAFAASVAATSAPPLAPLNLTAQSNRLRRAVDKNKWMSPSKL